MMEEQLLSENLEYKLKWDIIEKQLNEMKVKLGSDRIESRKLTSEIENLNLLNSELSSQL